MIVGSPVTYVRVQHGLQIQFSSILSCFESQSGLAMAQEGIPKLRSKRGRTLHTSRWHLRGMRWRYGMGIHGGGHFPIGGSTGDVYTSNTGKPPFTFGVSFYAWG